MITDVKRERVAMTREECRWWANFVFQTYKEKLWNKGMVEDAKAAEKAQTMVLEALSAEAEPTVIRCKTLLNAEDFEAVATRIRKENRNVIVIPCETEVASAEAVSREEYEETDGVITIEKQSAKDVGEIKHIVVCSPNYTRYFYNESMPIPSAEAVHKPDYSYEADMVKRLKESLSAEAVQGEWDHMIAEGNDGSHWYEYECSHCGEVVLRPYNFCPNCGADMTGSRE